MATAYTCSVCEVGYPSSDELTPFELPLFRYEGRKPVEGWKSGPSICKACLKRHGQPIKVFHRPHATDICAFASGAEVVMSGSGPGD